MSFDLHQVAIREPAVLIRDPLGTPAYFWPQKEFTIKPVVEYFPVPAAHHATPEERIKSLHYEITTQFVGAFENLPLHFPLLSASLGASILGASDVPWRLITQSGRQWDWPRGGFTMRPEITTVPGQTLFGQSTFAAVCASAAEPGDEGAFYTYSTGGTFPDLRTFSPAAILTLAPLVSFTGRFWLAQGENGISIQFAWKTKEMRVNGLIRDWTLESQELTAKFKPYSIPFDTINLMCGHNLAMGAQIPTGTLTVQYSGLYIELRGATCKEAQFKIGPSADFIDGLQFRASQTYTSGAQIALGYIDVTY